MAAAATKSKPLHQSGAALSRAERTATDDLKREVAEIRTEIGKLTADNIKTRWHIGRRIRTIVTDTTGKYGVDPKAEIEALMPLSRDGIRPMVQLAAQFEEADIDALLAHRHPVTNEGVTWSHLAAISRVRDKTKALKFVERAVTKGWSSKELVEEIVRDQGGPRSKGGRKPAKQETLAACLSAIISKTNEWSNAARESWLAEGGIDALYAAENVGPGTVSMLSKALTVLDEFAIQQRLVATELNSKLLQAQAQVRENSQLQKE